MQALGQFPLGEAALAPLLLDERAERDFFLHGHISISNKIVAPGMVP